MTVLFFAKLKTLNYANTIVSERQALSQVIMLLHVDINYLLKYIQITIKAPDSKYTKIIKNARTDILVIRCKR